MKNKYKFIGGLAVSGNYEANRLKRLASKGWILEDIVHGMFYKFRKDKPQKIYYDIDYNSNANDSYIESFKNKGWDKLLSFNDTMHIFYSPRENEVISSDLRLDRYSTMKDIAGKQIILCAIINLIVMAISALFMYLFAPALMILALVFMVTLGKLFATITDYCQYNEKIKMTKKYGDCKEAVANYKVYLIEQVITAVLFLVFAIIEFSYKEMYGFFLLFFVVLNVISGYGYYKKYKKGIKELISKN